MPLKSADAVQEWDLQILHFIPRARFKNSNKEAAPLGNNNY